MSEHTWDMRIVCVREKFLILEIGWAAPVFTLTKYERSIVNPWRMRRMVTVVVLCVCVCLSVCYQANCYIPPLRVQSAVL